MKPAVEILLRVLPATLALGAAGLLVGNFSARASGRAAAQPPSEAPVARVERDAHPPIEAEARLFAVAAPLENPAARRRTAHPRTLATFRSLRPFPGAPPRVPHGLTADEFRQTRCLTCHARGGYAMRFEAYAPVTPHPELADCLQCHLADDAVVGVSFPAGDGDALCRQCHAPAARRASAAANDWRGASWPAVTTGQRPGAPPVIPHDLQMRGNCVACHAGPGAVQEIRTTHAAWSSCFQCHVTVSTAAAFSRGRGTP